MIADPLIIKMLFVQPQLRAIPLLELLGQTSQLI